jgi:methionine-rich copper-binding protein CopC
VAKRNQRPVAASLALLLCAGCAANSGETPAQAVNAGAEQPATASILAASAPAAGSMVRAPVNELVLHFSSPARLLEVTVTGPDGAMPMMVSAVGEVEHYSLPLSGLGAGRYAVAWRASRGGAQHQGSFEFTVE